MLRYLAVSILALLLPLPALAQTPPPDATDCIEIESVQTKKPVRKPPPFRATHTVAGPDGLVPVETRQMWSLCKV